MNTKHDPEETQLAPTEPFVTPPTELACENQPTVISPYGFNEEPFPYYPYDPVPPPPPAGSPQQHQEHAQDVPWHIIIPSVGAGALGVTGVVCLIAMKDDALKYLGWIIIGGALILLMVAAAPYCSLPGKGDAPGLAGV